MALITKRLVESFRADPRNAREGLLNSLKEGAIKTTQWDIGDLFSECFGYESLNRLRKYDDGETWEQILKESDVNTSAFVNINRQFLYTTFLEAYEYQLTNIVQAIPTIPANGLKKMIVPGVTQIAGENYLVEEGEAYPEAGVTETYIETPEVRKRGVMVNVTKEAIYFDRTGLISEHVSKLGENAGLDRQVRALVCITDNGETTSYQYRYRFGKTSTGLATIATYGDSSGNHNWDNLAASNPLTDYQSLQTSWQLLKQMRDPYNNQRIQIQARHLVCGPSLATQAIFATNGVVQRVTPGFATSGNPVRTEINNPTTQVIGALQLLGHDNQYLEDYSGAATTWYMGDVGKAFRYVEAWPFRIDSQAASGPEDFNRDILLRYKGSEMGTYATFEPRAMIKCTA